MEPVKNEKDPLKVITKFPLKNPLAVMPTKDLTWTNNKR